MMKNQVLMKTDDKIDIRCTIATLQMVRDIFFSTLLKLFSMET